MPADFLSAGGLVLSWGATYLVHSTLLLGGVWILLTWKRTLSHSFRESLWKTALVGGVVTASAQMILPAGAPPGKFTFAIDGFRLPAVSPNTAEIGHLEIVSRAVNSDLPEPLTGWHTIGLVEGERSDANGESWDSKRSPTAGVALPLNASETAILVAARNATPPEPEAAWSAARDAMPRIPAAVVLAFIVCAGLVAVALGVTRCAWQTLSLRRKLGRCLPISTGPVRRLLDELCRHIPRTPEVLLLSDPADPEPAAFGIRRWVIVLPERAAEDLPEDELRALLAHELAHLVRGDAQWLCVSRIICSSLAFQPLNNLARREWQRAAEFLCDEWAVSRTGTRLALARCLAEVAGWRLSGQPSAALLAATGRKSSLADRIERLVASPHATETWTELRRRRRMLLGGALGLALLVWCAPRVQLALAARDGAPVANSQFDQDTALSREDGIGDVHHDGRTEAAKPQAPGEGMPAPAEENADLSPDLSNEAPWTRRRDLPSHDLPTLLASLDRELSALENELRDLEPLLRNGDVSPSVQKLAERIQIEIKLLAGRRDALRAHWKKAIIPR